MAEVEAVVIESNVAEFILSKAKVGLGRLFLRRVDGQQRAEVWSPSAAGTCHSLGNAGVFVSCTLVCAKQRVDQGSPLLFPAFDMARSGRHNHGSHTKSTLPWAVVF